MEQLTSRTENDVLVFGFHGRIDSTNADKVAAEVDTITAATPHSTVTVDADDLIYISSAGLRILLKLRKGCPDMKMINVSSDVYEILEMTGFSEMIAVEKGYRRLSVEGCEAIGKGANGAVYRLDPETIIKVYLNPDSLPDIKRERELARKAFILGIPTAIPYDVVKVGDGYGSVFELLNSDPLARKIANEPDKWEEYTDMSIDLLKKIHSTEVQPEDMPDMKEVALEWVDYVKPYLPEKEWTRLHEMVAAVPESNTMLHGDYHVKNVMLQNGEALLIDMDTLCHGDIIFEFASIYNAYLGFSAINREHVEKFLGLPRTITTGIWQRTISRYFETDDPQRLAEIEDKASLIGYVRILRRNIKRDGAKPGDEKFDFYKKEIIDRINRLDSLVF